MEQFASVIEVFCEPKAFQELKAYVRKTIIRKPLLVASIVRKVFILYDRKQ